MTDRPPQAQITRTRRALREGASPSAELRPLVFALFQTPPVEHPLTLHAALARPDVA